ncbi:MAG TPA: HPF/RaiA family ribosome-associated protein [Candidatus Saccharimonadales bacterium]|nr:HPF/RaiA family ribosome-associated protein [Candidatus Saccharimonadales bacterium]
MKIHLNATGLELTGDLEKYAGGKLAKLAKRVPRKLRVHADCTVTFTLKRKKGAKFNTCTIVLKLDGTELKAEETTLHMYAALDIALVHVRQQLKDYVAKQRSRRPLARLQRHFRRG